MVFLQCDKLEKIAVIFAPHTYLLLRNPSLWFMVHSRKVRKTVKREAKPERGRVEFETRKLAFPWILICIPKSAFLSTYLYVKCSEKGFASNPGIIYGGCASSIVNFYLVKKPNYELQHETIKSWHLGCKFCLKCTTYIYLGLFPKKYVMLRNIRGALLNFRSIISECQKWQD